MGRRKKPLRVTTSKRFTSQEFLDTALDDIALNIREEAERNLESLADNLVADMQLRTTSGRDIAGQFFEDYSEIYGRLVKGRTQPVDLTLGGAMLQDILAVPAGDLRILILASDPKGAWHQEGRFRSKGGRLPARPWFGVSQAGLARFAEDFELALASAEEEGFDDVGEGRIFVTVEL